METTGVMPQEDLLQEVYRILVKDGSLKHYTQHVEGSAIITGPEGDGEPEPWAVLPTPPEGGTPEQPGALPPEPLTEEEGFFARLVNSIRGFLKRVF